MPNLTNRSRTHGKTDVDPRRGNFRMLMDLCLPMDRTNSAKFSKEKKTKTTSRTKMWHEKTAASAPNWTDWLYGLHGATKRNTARNDIRNQPEKEWIVNWKVRRTKQASQPKPPLGASSNRHSAVYRMPKRTRTSNGKFWPHIALAYPFSRTQCSENVLRT